MSVLTPHRRRRTFAGALVGAVVGTVATTSALVAAPAAQAAAPDGSAYEIFLEAGSATGSPANAVTVGKWGHEGPNRDQGTVVSADLGADGAGAALFEALGFPNPNSDANYGQLALAFAPTSADGSTERPAVEANESVGQAFEWFTEQSFGTAFSGTPNTPSTDEVLKVSTLAEYTAWQNAGSPDQLASSSDLIMRDVLVNGAPASTAPKGKSILNRWAADQNISLVLVRTTGETDSKGLPIVARGADGKAITAWLTFRTGLDSSVGNGTIATSGAYTVTSALTTPVVELTNGTVGSTTTLTAALKSEAGSALSDADPGTVQFSALPADQNDGEYVNLGDPVAVSDAGTATFQISDLAPGSFRRYRALYTPTGDAAGRYTSATSNPRTVTRPAQATTTTIAISGTRVAGARQTLTGTVTTTAEATPAGSIRFLDGVTVLATVPLAEGATTATRVVALGAGAHSLKAQFVPTGTSFAGSTSAASAVSIARARAVVAAKVSPASVRVRTKPKLAITVKAAGLVPTGKVTVKVTAPGKKAVSVVGTLRNGVVTVTLPAAVKGTTKLTVAYGGSASVLPATAAASYKAR